MAVFTIADLHLSHTTNKPMDVFGAKWENHVQRLESNWKETVGEGDTVVIPGDISWGMRIDDAEEDLRFIERLPGKKIIGKGNHDFWWATMKKLYEFRERAGAYSVEFLFNNAYRAEDFIICGTRGWFPESNYGPDDERIVNREAERLRTSLLAGKALKADGDPAETLVFLHYPPAYGGVRCERICEVIHEFGIKRVFYGHIHGARREKLIYQIAGAESRLIAADFVDFRPVRVDKR